MKTRHTPWLVWLLAMSPLLQAADAGFAAEGFLQQWWLLEPVKVAGQLSDSAVRATVEQMQLPEPRTAVPQAGSSVSMQGATLQWHHIASDNYNINLYRFAHNLGLPTSNVLFWAVTELNLPTELHNVRLAIGSNAASVWWIDGKEVIALYNDRQTVIDDGVSQRLHLKAGPHVIRAAILNGGGATDFTARFLDENGKALAASRLGPGRGDQ